MKIISNAQKVTIKTENGVARKVFIEDFELHGVTDVDIYYGVDSLPKVKIELYASEVDRVDERSGQDP